MIVFDHQRLLKRMKSGKKIQCVAYLWRRRRGSRASCGSGRPPRSALSHCPCRTPSPRATPSPAVKCAAYPAPEREMVGIRNNMWGTFKLIPLQSYRMIMMAVVGLSTQQFFSYIGTDSLCCFLPKADDRNYMGVRTPRGIEPRTAAQRSHMLRLPLPRPSPAPLPMQSLLEVYDQTHAI